MTNEHGITRREVLAGAGAFALASAANTAFAAGDMSHKQHSSGSKHAALVDSAFACIISGQACVAHCIELFKAGDATMGKCNAIVQQTNVMCEALAFLGSTNSNLLKDFAKVCMQSCKECEKECNVFANKIAECKDCATACRKCIDECEKLLAA